MDTAVFNSFVDRAAPHFRNLFRVVKGFRAAIPSGPEKSDALRKFQNAVANKVATTINAAGRGEFETVDETIREISKASSLFTDSLNFQRYLAPNQVSSLVFRPVENNINHNLLYKAKLADKDVDLFVILSNTGMTFSIVPKDDSIHDSSSLASIDHTLEIHKVFQEAIQQRLEAQGLQTSVSEVQE